MRLRGCITGILILLLLICQGCKGKKADSERIPNFPVHISLDNPGLWNTYGVSGFGSHRYFILNSLPEGFPYQSNSATGFGGVVLIEGLDPYNSLGSYPLAYDMACPVERNPEIRIVIDRDNYVAYCKQCGSTYDVTMAAGAPIGGEAASGKYRYSLKMYRVVASNNGGFNILN